MKNKIHLDLSLENGAEVDITITVNGGSVSADDPSEEELRACCAKYDDCDDCPHNNYCSEL